MSGFPRIYSSAWLIVLAFACGLLVWTTHRRIQRVDYVSGLTGRVEHSDPRGVASATGYALEQRELIVPERNEVSFGWIAQTQQMFARGEWRVRHVDDDNAPFGREVGATSPYRWWLGFVAEIDHLISGRPIGLSVEHAARYADPWLQALLLVTASAFVGWRFGGGAAGIFCLGLAVMYPFAAGFLPGEPDHRGMARICALGSVLVLLAGLRDTERPTRWFVFGGILGGLGLWIEVRLELPILIGLILGAIIAACSERLTTSSAPTMRIARAPWRIWALSGGTTVLAAYLLEFFPAHLGEWRLESLHPLYGLAWLGGAELLIGATQFISGARSVWDFRAGATIFLGAAAVVAVPLAMKFSGSQGILARDLLSVHLTGEPGGVVAASSWVWLVRDGASAPALIALLPLILLFAAGWWLLRRETNWDRRLGLALALGPSLIALGFASKQVAWWPTVDGMLLVLIVAGAAPSETESSRSPCQWWMTGSILCVLPGLIQLWPGKRVDATTVLTPSEAQELIERHLAHWLAERTEETGAVVYAPPHQTTTLSFFGGFRGIGTLVPENRAGFGVTLMIAAANTIEEAQALIQSRGVRYVVVPSWDPFFDEFAGLYLDRRFSARTSFLVNSLRRWHLPPWLRPVPYQMPEISGFEGQSVLVFEVVDDQSPAIAAARLTEYLSETGRLDQAVTASDELRRYPGDVSALAARAQVFSTREDPASFAQTLELLVSRLSSGGDRFLPWDRRVSLAIVLAQADQMTLAKEQVRRCLTEINASRLRALSTGSLYKLLVLGHALSIEITDTRLRALAIGLLPSELRSQL